MKKSKTYLVTGGAGFIGSHLSEKLINDGNTVVCFDDLSSGSLKNISFLMERTGFHFIKGDANKLKDIEPVFKKYNDLDALAGGWSKQETKDFLADIKIFEKIDKDIWQ